MEIFVQGKVVKIGSKLIHLSRAGENNIKKNTEVFLSSFPNKDVSVGDHIWLYVETDSKESETVKKTACSVIHQFNDAESFLAAANERKRSKKAYKDILSMSSCLNAHVEICNADLEDAFWFYDEYIDRFDSGSLAPWIYSGFFEPAKGVRSILKSLSIDAETGLDRLKSLADNGAKLRMPFPDENGFLKLIDFSYNGIAFKSHHKVTSLVCTQAIIDLWGSYLKPFLNQKVFMHSLVQVEDPKEAEAIIKKHTSYLDIQIEDAESIL